MSRLPRKTKKLMKRQCRDAARRELAKHQTGYIPILRYNLSMDKGPYQVRINPNQQPQPIIFDADPNRTLQRFHALLDENGFLPPN